MATIFNANTTEGLVITPDTSGEMVFQSNGTQVLKVTGATGSFDVPVGTTAERPASPTTGTIRYNTTEGALETYDGSAWTSVGASTWTTTGSNIYYNTGKVGIGTSSPAQKLQVSSTGDNVILSSGGSGAAGYIVANGNGRSNLTGGLILLSYSNGTAEINNSSNSNLNFKTNSVERMRLDSSGNLKFNSGYGSVATAYGCRAWVNFNGDASPITIRGSGNVSSITDSGVGKYTVNFTTAMPDTNYTVTGIAGDSVHAGNVVSLGCNTWGVSQTTSSTRIAGLNDAGTLQDKAYANIAVFR